MRQPEVRAGKLTNFSRPGARLETPPRRDHRGRRGARFARGVVVLASLVGGAASSACYRYVPVSPGTIAPNDEVRIHVTDDAAARLSKDLGAFVTEIDGQFAPQGSDSVSIAIPIDRQYHGMTVGTTSQVLYLGRSEVVDVRRREFDRRRTILVSVGAVVGFGVLAAGIVQLADPNPDSQEQPPPPPPSPSRVPARHGFTLRIPIP